MLKQSTTLMGAAVFGVISVFASRAHAWDHPGHMTTAAIAFAEIERMRPGLIEKIGNLLLAHPDPGPFWVAAGDAKGKERIRRMFIEGARWPDDAKFTSNDITVWHTARWAIIAKDAPPEAKAAVAALKGRPRGHAIEALKLNFGMVSNTESTPAERARALSWVLHIMGDLHQPLHVSDLYSKGFPAGNAAATRAYVTDPLSKTKGTIPLHMLWDSNVMRITSLEVVDRHAKEFVKKYPRSSFPELRAIPVSDPDVFRKWARESHRIAVEWAYDIETLPDPNKYESSDELVKNMVKFVLDGISPVKEAPEVPAEYWKKLQDTAHRRVTLAGYRIADLIVSAADQIAAEKAIVYDP